MNKSFNIYRHHDIRELLEDFVAFKKSKDPSYSLRKFSNACAFSSGYLSLVLSHKRNLSLKSLNKFIVTFKFKKEEAEFIKLLWTLSESSSQKERENAFKSIYKIREYRNENPEELNAHHYLKTWINIAIRELTQLDEFKADPQWIKRKLNFKVSIQEIRNSLNFLFNHNYLEKNKRGQVSKPNTIIECHGGVYKLSMSHFHTQMAKLAADSIYETNREKRNLLSQTIAINPKHFDKIRDIMNEAVKKINDLAESDDNKKVVYQISQFAFPLSKESLKE